MHDSNMVHRDLKPENVLYSSKDQDRVIKLIDFGLSTYITSNHKLTTYTGTPCYMAPEVWDGKYGKECDVWSLGVFLYTLLSAHRPFTGETNSELCCAIRKGDINLFTGTWQSVSEEAKDLIRKMLVTDPSNRLTIQQVLNHIWIREEQEDQHETNVQQYDQNLNLVEILATLQQYQCTERLQSEIKKIIINQMPEDNLQYSKKVFEALDTDHTGYLTSVKLKKAYSSIKSQLTGAELMNIIDQVDQTSRGKISLIDFLVATVDIESKLTEKMLSDAFALFDKEEQGYVSYAHFRKIILKNNIYISLGYVDVIM